MNVYLLTNIFEGKREVKGCFETSDAAYDFMAEKQDAQSNIQDAILALSQNNPPNESPVKY